MWRLVVSTLVLAVGCSSSHDGEPRRPDAGLDCAPEGVPVSWTCPAGCTAVKGRLIDPEAACLTDARVVLTCYVEGVQDGAVGCFERGEDDSVRVLSPTTSVRGERSEGANLLEVDGWQSCEESLDSAPECE